MKYCVKANNKGSIVVVDNSTNYSLFIARNQDISCFNPRFETPFPAWDTPMLVTARDLNEYPRGSFKVERHKQYTEVGAGLGEFVSYAVQRCIRPVIVIDPVDYGNLYAMIKYARYCLELPGKMKQRLEVLSKRCRNMLNRKVRHIRKTLDQAIADMPELEGSSDVVVDSVGAVGCNDEFLVLDLEKRLLRSNGTLLTHC